MDEKLIQQLQIAEPLIRQEMSAIWIRLTNRGINPMVIGIGIGIAGFSIMGSTSRAINLAPGEVLSQMLKVAEHVFNESSRLYGVETFKAQCRE